MRRPRVGERKKRHHVLRKLPPKYELHRKHYKEAESQRAREMKIRADSQRDSGTKKIGA